MNFKRLDDIVRTTVSWAGVSSVLATGMFVLWLAWRFA